MTTQLLHVSPRALALDSETCRFDRALMAPPVVCVQWGRPDGSHAVVPTPGVRDALAWAFSGEFDQLWLHNGPYDLACFLEWYPELAHLIWKALENGIVLDTMYLQRMVQIARGDIGGPLGLEPVTQLYGVPPPTKEILATIPQDYPVVALRGQQVDVRTTFHLFYGWDKIPNPWHDYADYDGIATIQLADRMVKRWCIPAAGQKYSTVNLSDLAETTRKYAMLNLSRVYGLHINPTAVNSLRGAARVALLRLRENALELNLISPVPATRKEVTAGLRGSDRYCPVHYERRPAAPLDPKKLASWDPERLPELVRKWEARQKRHANCVGCKWQARDEVTGELKFKKNTDVLKALVIAAYEGKPPITEAKKGKDGKKTGGGNISTSRDTLQDSENEELKTWSSYNEWGALMSKDMKIMAHSPVHTHFGLANTMRPTSSNPNILNFRRTSFYIATCDVCGYEETVDPREVSKTKAGATFDCPMCATPAEEVAP
jgi:predicted nucleic-acid-binding Zn-ribbon protein